MEQTQKSAPQTLYLDVTLNQADRGLAPFELVDGELFARVETLRTLGFILPGKMPAERLALTHLPGLEVHYDAALQRLTLQAPLDQLSLPTTILKNEPTATPEATASPGLLLNYDLYANRADTVSNASLTTELRSFGTGKGIFDTTAIFHAEKHSPENRWDGTAVRLNSSWELNFPDSATSLRVGDFYSGFLDWSRSIRLGGVQIGRNYALQPYRVLTPTPTFLGQATVPSTVELYVDGLRQYSGRVPAGPFQLAAQPDISGTGQAQIVVTDAFGQVRRLNFAFYGTQRLLAKDVSDWSAGIGHLRRDYGIRSFSYQRQTVASANWRKGIRQNFTFELQGEAGGGLINAGLGGIWLLGSIGVVNLAYAHSEMTGLQGSQLALGYAWNSRRFNFNIGSQRTHGGYRDLGALQDSLPANISDRANFGVNTAIFGSLGAGYVRLSYPNGNTSRYASIFWSRNFGRTWSASLSVNQNLNERTDRNTYFSISTSFGLLHQASLSVQRSGDRGSVAADLTRPLPGDGDLGGLGWRVQARSDNTDSGGLAEIGMLNRFGRYGAGLSHQNGNNFGYASASGSLAWLEGRAFAARDIQDAFAVVSTDGYAGVPVRLENRLIGVTDRHGLLLITPLQSWQRNQLSIDTLELPANLQIDRVEAIVTPRQQSGVSVHFGITREKAAIVVLHDTHGQPLPPGSSVQLAGQTQPIVVGYDGEVYLDHLLPQNRLQAELPSGRCSVIFDAPGDAETIPRLGPLTCLPAQTR